MSPDAVRRDETELPGYRVIPAARSREPIPPVPNPPRQDPRRVDLGRRLFQDPRLSGDGSVSCATCHDLDHGGDGGERFSAGVGGVRGRRNSPTVFNTALNFRQFWDGRARTLLDQVDDPLLNPSEMGGSWDEVLEVVRADSAYSRWCEEIYGGVTREAVRDAIASFERSLLTPNSPFDRYLQGDSDAITPDAARGFALFKELGCVACHQGANVGGNMFQRFGVVIERDAGADADLGRYHVTGRDEDRFVFKVPGLRNVALTAPYFHDGSAATLGEAVRVMARYQLGLELEAEQERLLLEFLGSLTGELH